MPSDTITIVVQIPVIFPAKRCCYCGDKIKDGICLELSWDDGTVNYLESCCVRGFVGDEPPEYGRQYPESKKMIEASLALCSTTGVQSPP